MVVSAMTRSSDRSGLPARDPVKHRYGHPMTGTTDLTDLSERYWLAFSRYVPTVATTRGEHRFDDQLPVYEEDWLGEISGEFEAIVDLARQIALEGLGTQDRITRDLLIHEAGVWADEIHELFRKEQWVD